MEGSNRNVFWGLVIKPGKRYETTVQEPFRITKACVEPATAKDGKITSVYVENDINEEFIIANLNLKSFNEGLDLSFNEGEKICFKVDGSGTVHLTGNLLDDPPPGADMFDMDDSEDDSEAMEDSEEETVEAGNKIKEVSEKEAAKLKRKKEQAENGKKKKAKVSENGDSTIDTTVGDLDDTNNFAEEEDSEDDDDDEDDESDDDSDEATTDVTTDFADTTAADDDSDDDDDDSDEESEEESKPEPKKSKQKEETPKKEGKSKEVKTPKQEVKTPKSEKKAEAGKTPKQETKTPKQEAKTPKQEAKTPKQETKTPKQEAKAPKDDSKTPGKTPKRTIKGGIQVEDIKEGSGPECKPGSSVGMYYEGRLKSNNKKFDGLKAGDPFKFKLGGGQVIKGWDLGILGMKVGGKRKLTIPPKLAYGESGAPPDIPPNSTLVFDIECKFVK